MAPPGGDIKTVFLSKSKFPTLSNSKKHFLDIFIQFVYYRGVCISGGQGFRPSMFCNYAPSLYFRPYIFVLIFSSLYVSSLYVSSLYFRPYIFVLICFVLLPRVLLSWVCPLGGIPQIRRLRSPKSVFFFLPPRTWLKDVLFWRPIRAQKFAFLIR